MASGQNKLLSIAIPTWNRADQLKVALEWLLPQVVNHIEDIEFIISDNCSTDNTVEIVNKIITDFPEIDFVFNQQSENTGFFGNFQKCTELGTAKFFWLLSDDDYVFPDLISEILDVVKKNEVGAIFLNDWTNDIDAKEQYNIDFLNKEEFFSDRPYRHSLISSVIYRHNVLGDDIIFQELKGNALVAYAVFLKAIHSYNNFAVIKGNSLFIKNDHNVRFNALEIFTNDLDKVIKNISSKYSNRILYKVNNSFVGTLIFGHYKDFKYNMKYQNSQICGKNLIRNYGIYSNFWLHVFPIILFNKKIYSELVDIKNRL
jgi:glycosyltransferase involved in cell wall biosynthesis